MAGSSLWVKPGHDYPGFYMPGSLAIGSLGTLTLKDGGVATS